MSDLISALKAHCLVLANASSNVANMNSRDYRSIRTTLTSDVHGNVGTVTSRSTVQGVPDGEGHELSNVDLPREICDMIRAQQGFESVLNAIAVREDMLDDLMNTLTEAD